VGKEDGDMKFNPDKSVGGRTNEQRADDADWALRQPRSEPTEENIIDLITNLLHLADREGLDCQQIIGAAIQHHETER
jgi:hypothetical protein